jgi:multicomponent Na+:H+ antiporter subunit E
VAGTPSQGFVLRAVALAVWAFGVWLLITWTVTAEQLLFGAGVAIVVGLSLAPLGAVVAPWRLLDPRRLAAVLFLIATSLARVVRANVVLAGRIWAPSRPVRSGMLIVPTAMRSDANIGATGLITSLIVDNQIVDLDTERHELQFHAVSVPEGDKDEQSESINAPIERLLARIAGRA